MRRWEKIQGMSGGVGLEQLMGQFFCRYFVREGRVPRAAALAGRGSWWLVEGAGEAELNPVVRAAVSASGLLWEGTPGSEVVCSIHVINVQVAGAQDSVLKTFQIDISSSSRI